MVTTVPAMFQATITRFAERPALLAKEGGRYRPTSYSEVARKVDALGAYLLESGVGVGERVALLSENRPEWAIADQAVLGIGAVDVPLYPTLDAEAIARALNDCGACAVIASTPAQLAKLRQIASKVPSLRLTLVFDEPLEPVDGLVTYHEALVRGEALLSRHAGELRSRREMLRPDDLASIVYTSGTTGAPRGAMLTHGNLTSNAHASVSALGLTPDDVALSFLPLSHVLERSACYASLAVGASVAYAERLETLAQNLAEVRPTFFCAVPRILETFYRRTIAQLEAEAPLKRELFWAALEIGEFFHKVMQEDGRVTFPTNALYHAADRLVFRQVREALGGRLRFIVSGGAPLSHELGCFFQAVGVPVAEGYGLTECAPVLTLNPPEAIKLGTVGRALPGVTIRLSADGEIIVRGPNVMKGYWNDETATREVLDAEGWLRTGDLGELDDEGYLTLVDRKQELLALADGLKVAPQPIERRLLAHPLVAQAMLLGEGRRHMTVLLVPELGEAARIAAEAGHDWKNDVELVSLSPVREALHEVVEAVNAALSARERIQRFQALAHAFTFEGGELTPTFKLKRRVVADKYREEIETLYRDKVLAKTR
ncbi:long-chain fatty acid--CoA ligase [bacterium]|nr:long-chain fatty acid--CoA ligase [bacterium]